MNESENLGCGRTVLVTLLALITIVALLAFGTVVAPLEPLTTQNVSVGR
jgi:uncharacterized membrane protein YdfJ with MMPL/SSD domain